MRTLFEWVVSRIKWSKVLTNWQILFSIILSSLHDSQEKTEEDVRLQEKLQKLEQELSENRYDRD